MILKDNSKYSSSSSDVEEFLSLQNIANRKISDLLTENKKLLIYPHSFVQCEDRIDEQHLFSLHTHWVGKQCTQVSLETGNIAGFISVKGKPISIYSRFTPEAKEDLFLHYLLNMVLNIHIVNLPHGTANEQIFDFLLYLFPKHLNDALSQGIYKEYKNNEYNNANLRGTINICKHIRTNLPFNGNIAYHAREFSHDNHITELIRHTIEYINTTRHGRSLLDNNADTKANVEKILAATPHYNRNERSRIIKLNSKIFYHPYYSSYAPLQKLCLKILRHEHIKYGHQENFIYGVLFDVSYLWEEYLAKILTRIGFCHPHNKRRTNPIYLAQSNKLPRYPDFYRGEENSIIVDAKYKKEINRDDIHQMLAYMYRLKGTIGIFIKPTEKSPSYQYWENSYSLLGYGKDKHAELKTFCFPIPQETINYHQFEVAMADTEKTLKALSLKLFKL